MTESELESMYFRLGRLERRVLELESAAKDKDELVIATLELSNNLEKLQMRVLELENEQGVEERANRTEEVDLSPKWFVLCRDDNGGLTFATRRWFATSQVATVYASTVAPTRGAFVVYSLGLPGYEEHSFGK
jgi:hypothetical protein